MMVVEVTRHIKSVVERELWARAGGRCQFSGCNELLYKSPITQEAVNLAEKAHIYSFSEKGPRGWGPFKLGLEKLNDISNLMLVCNGCHEKIDQDKQGVRYSAELLIRWKAEHEERIEIVTAITPDKKSHVLIYGANIGSEKSPIEYHACVRAMFPNWYPAQERPILTSTRSELKDNTAQYWQSEMQHLLRSFKSKIYPLIEDHQCKHFSLFALAPQPLLIWLGALLTDKISVETYQLHREPKGWGWQEFESDFNYIIRKPSSFSGRVALVIALSDNISHERITRVLGNDASIWEITIDNPHNDFMKGKQQLSMFRKYIRSLMVDIKREHGSATPLHIFPAMPVSCAIELGRARMPKADMPWRIFDSDVATRMFTFSLDIAGDIHEH